MTTMPAHSGGFTTMLANTRPSNGVGHGGEFYPGEGSMVTAGEYHNALEPFLGPPTKAIDAQPSNRFPHEAWFLPDAYAGHNDYVRQTIVDIVINYNSFVTRDILPWREQDNPNIAWDSIKFDKTLIDMEPEQGVPRYVTVERESHSDHMVRRGLALIVNHGFAATPAGQKDFMYKVATIAGAVQETCDQAGLMALLRSKNEYRHLVVDSARDATEAYSLFQHELWRFGIIQHSERGWYHMDAEAQHVMRQENIQPDTWIVPPRMTAYAAMGQHAETEVYRAGEKTARGNLERGEDNFSTFRGKRVYETKPYTLDVDGRRIDPLNRTRMIGDFFVVPFWEVCIGPNDDARSVPASGETQVYCCESDRFETFKWESTARELWGDNTDGVSKFFTGFHNIVTKLAKERTSGDQTDKTLRNIVADARKAVSASQGALGFYHSLGMPVPSFMATMSNANDVVVDAPVTAAMEIDNAANDRINKLERAQERMKLENELLTNERELEAATHRLALATPTAAPVSNPTVDDAERIAFLKRTARENFEADNMRVYTEMKATPAPAAIVPPHLAHHTTSAGPIRQAFDMAFARRYRADNAHTVDYAANTWAKYLVDQGFDKHKATDAARQAIHDVWLRDHLDAGAFTEKHLTTDMYLEPHGNGTRRSQDEVVRDLHDIWMRGDDAGAGFALALENSKERGLQLARAGTETPHIMMESALAVGSARNMVKDLEEQMVTKWNPGSKHEQKLVSEHHKLGQFKSKSEVLTGDVFFEHTYNQKELKQMYERHGPTRVSRTRVYPEIALKILETTEATAFLTAARELLSAKRRTFFPTQETESYLGCHANKVADLERVLHDAQNSGRQNHAVSLAQLNGCLNKIKNNGSYVYSLVVESPKQNANRASVKDHSCIGNDGLQPVFPNLSNAQKHTRESQDISKSTYHGGMPCYTACPEHVDVPTDVANLDVDDAFDKCMELLFIAGNRANKKLLTMHPESPFAHLLELEDETGVRFHSAPSEVNLRSMRAQGSGPNAYADINMVVPNECWEACISQAGRDRYRDAIGHRLIRDMDKTIIDHPRAVTIETRITAVTDYMTTAGIPRTIDLNTRIAYTIESLWKEDRTNEVAQAAAAVTTLSQTQHAIALLIAHSLETRPLLMAQGGVPGVRSLHSHSMFRFDHSEDRLSQWDTVSATAPGIILPFVSVATEADAAIAQHAIESTNYRSFTEKRGELHRLRSVENSVQERQDAKNTIKLYPGQDASRLLRNFDGRYGGVVPGQNPREAIVRATGNSKNNIFGDSEENQWADVVAALNDRNNGQKERFAVLADRQQQFLEPDQRDTNTYTISGDGLKTSAIVERNTPMQLPGYHAIPNSGVFDLPDGKIERSGPPLILAEPRLRVPYDPRSVFAKAIPEYAITDCFDTTWGISTAADSVVVQEDLGGSAGLQNKLPYDNKVSFYNRQINSRFSLEAMKARGDNDPDANLWKNGGCNQEHYMCVAEYRKEETGCHTFTKRQNRHKLTTLKDNLHGDLTVRAVREANAENRIDVVVHSQQSMDDVTNTKAVFTESVKQMTKMENRLGNSDEIGWDLYTRWSKRMQDLKPEEREKAMTFVTHRGPESPIDKKIAMIDGSMGYMHRFHIGMFDRPSLPACFSRLNIFNSVTSLANFDIHDPWTCVVPAAGAGAQMTAPPDLTSNIGALRIENGLAANALREQQHVQQCDHRCANIRRMLELFDVPSDVQAQGAGTCVVDPSAVAYDLLCFRPFRQYTMGTGILLKRGSELGNTFRGWADFQLTDNIIAKTHIGHFTFWHASVVTNPKMLFLAEDIFCTNYIGGEGKKVLPFKYHEDFREDPLGTMQAHRASIICMPVPVGAINPRDKRLNTNNPISLTGHLNPHVREMAGQQDAHRVHIGDYELDGLSREIQEDMMNAYGCANNSTRSGALSGADYSRIYDQIYNFSGMNHEVDYENARTFETSARLINTVCFHTMQKFRNPQNNRWEVTNLNTGHFGENGIYEGVKKIRCGFIEYYRDMEYQKAMAYGGLGA